jgi:oligopeptide transport system substrate-binding protein
MPSIPLFTRQIIYGDSARLASGDRNPLDRLVTTSFRLNPQG